MTNEQFADEMMETDHYAGALRLVESIRAAERERCALICDEVVAESRIFNDDYGIAMDCADRIRAQHTRHDASR